MDIERELFFMARELVATPDIAGMFRKFNSRYFDNEIPNIPVKWGRSKVWAGICKGTWNKATREGIVKSIILSTYVQNADLDVLEGIMLHEMVHAVSIVKGQHDGHGLMFSILLRKYSRKSGRDIPRTESLSNFEVPEEVETKSVGVVVYRGKGLMTYNWNAFKASMGKIIERLEKEAQYRKMDVTLLKVEDRELMLYPEKRRFKIEYFRGKQDLINRVFNIGKELARVTSGHSTQIFASALRMGSRIAAAPMTENQYILSKGVAVYPPGEPGLHRTPRRLPKSQQRQNDRMLSERQYKWQKRIDALREEYRQKVMDGKLRPPTRIERYLNIAKGHPELSSVQAARRILRKQGLWDDQLEEESDARFASVRVAVNLGPSTGGTREQDDKPCSAVKGANYLIYGSVGRGVN